MKKIIALFLTGIILLSLTSISFAESQSDRIAKVVGVWEYNTDTSHQILAIDADGYLNRCIASYAKGTLSRKEYRLTLDPENLSRFMAVSTTDLLCKVDFVLEITDAGLQFTYFSSGTEANSFVLTKMK